jgi:hypothetical protein
LVLTGKTFGVEEIQVTELVRSLTCGEVENVPSARKFPVSCRLPTVIMLGIMVSESRGSGAGVDVTVTFVVADTTLLSGFVHSAVIVVLPALAPMTSPELDALQVAGIVTGEPLLQIVAIDGTLELHVRYPVVELGVVELVTSSSRPVVPEVPSAISWPVWPDADRVSVPGITVSAVIDSDTPPVTMKVPVPVATVLSAFVAMAVIVVLPLATAVARPVCVMVATDELLELQVTEPVTFSVTPAPVVPIAMN